MMHKCRPRTQRKIEGRALWEWDLGWEWEWEWGLRIGIGIGLEGRVLGATWRRRVPSQGHWHRLRLRFRLASDKMNFQRISLCYFLVSFRSWDPARYIYIYIYSKYIERLLSRSQSESQQTETNPNCQPRNAHNYLLCSATRGVTSFSVPFSVLFSVASPISSSFSGETGK